MSDTTTREQAENLIARLDAMTRTIEEAEQNLWEGQAVDISHLDTDVAKICQEIETAQRETAIATEEPIRRMVAALDSLAATLRSAEVSTSEN